MDADAREWLRNKAERFLKTVGLAEGQRVLDFGCNEGNYTIPAAQIVGKTGKVYALDKDKDSLDKLVPKAKKKHLKNIRPLHVDEVQRCVLQPASVDVVLLYDILHRGYLPESAQRKQVLTRIHSALKPRGLLSCFPTHLRQYGMTLEKLLDEIRAVGFRLEDRHRRILVHDGSLVRGWIFGFSKDASPSGRKR